MTQLLGKIAADFETSLAVKMAIGATTGTLQVATDDDGVALPTGRYFLTIDRNNSSKEYISCTLTGTALTNVKTCSRQGVEVAGTLREHRVGANVIISDFAYIKKINDLFDGTSLFDSATVLGYDGAPSITTGNQLVTKTYVDSTTIPIGYLDTDGTLAANSDTRVATQKATKTYVDNTVAAGAPNASTTVKGIVEEATLAEVLAATAVGGTGARLFINPSTIIDPLTGRLIVTIAPVSSFSMGHIAGTDSAYSIFSDTGESVNITGAARQNIVLERKTQILQKRLITTDWASADVISSVTLLGSYLYAHVRDVSSNFRVYRFDKTNLAAGGTLMTIAGQAFGSTGGSETLMSCDGTAFYFNNTAGNSTNQHIVSKYSLSGTTLTFVSDITCGSTSANFRYLFNDNSGNIYGWNDGDSKIRKYNSSGTLQSTTDDYALFSGFLNIGGGTIYMRNSSNLNYELITI